MMTVWCSVSVGVGLGAGLAEPLVVVVPVAVSRRHAVGASVSGRGFRRSDLARNGGMRQPSAGADT